MLSGFQTRLAGTSVAAALFVGIAFDVQADVISDWNARAGELIVEAKLGTPPAIRVMALAHTAMYEAVNAVTLRDSARHVAPQAAPRASVDAAVAAANRVILKRLMPSQEASIEAAYQAALAKISDGKEKAVGIAAGEHAAAAVLTRRAQDLTMAPEAYRPYASAGAYVPTSAPAALPWKNRTPWRMTSPAQFRPGPPPALNSEAWTRDYNEVRAFGAKSSTSRSAEQTEVARFWEHSLPSIYYGLVNSVAQAPTRDVTQNARLFAAVSQAMDDAMISVFDAKYHFNFWRPVTAIRNGDLDDNDATERDAAWTSFIESPLHPEYPSAHTILAAAVGTVLKAEMRTGPTPELATVSSTAKGVVRRWTSVDEVVREVADARIYEGIHYRTSTEVGAEMGRLIGALAATELAHSQR
jgi:hypothetical protein